MTCSLTSTSTLRLYVIVTFMDILQLLKTILGNAPRPWGMQPNTSFCSN